MKQLTVNQIIELQSLTFMHRAFKKLLTGNLQTHFNLNTGNKSHQSNFKCQYSRQFISIHVYIYTYYIFIYIFISIFSNKKTQHCLSLIGVKLWNKTDKWILISNNIHMLKKKYKNYLK